MTATLIALALMATASGGDDWSTFYEQSNFKRTPTYGQTVDYCMRLADASPWVHYTTFGKSGRGLDLPLVIVDRNGHFAAEDVRITDNVVFLIQACIHAGESDGKDAGMMLIRDIAVRKELESLLDHVTIVFMPIFNVDGHERFGPYNRINQNGPEEMGWRTTAVNLNLNRDYLKADTPEMRAWLALYTEWLPEFFADCHVTDGADYQYVVTYAIENLGNMDDGVTAWLNGHFLPPLLAKMDAAGFPLIRYNSYRRRHDPRSGIVCWASPPRFSTGYAAIQNRPAILVESHMLKNYQTRVTGTYQLLIKILEILNQEHNTLHQLVRDSDEHTATAEFRKQPLALAFRSTGDSVMIDFRGYEYEVVDSDVTGGKWHRFSDRAATFTVPLFNVVEPVVSVALPEAYIIPPEWTDVIECLSRHGVRLARTSDAWSIPVHSYELTDPVWRSRPYEGRLTTSYQIREITGVRTYPTGSVVVPMNQRAAKVAAHLLEPAGGDSFVKWGFFNAIFEQKEYAESYVIEEYARAMLEQDENLKNEFEETMASDSTFAGDPRRIRRWFYRRTPFWDDRRGRYPVGLIRERTILESMPQ
jgi:hypothetical protein